MVRLAVPATTANLGSGYDCLGLALGMYNYLEMVPAEIWKLTVRGEGGETLPRDRTNLVWQSMCRLWEETGTQIPAVDIIMENNIPLARGLGSSAAVIVGGLTAANHWAGNPLAQDELLKLAVELEGHPDNVAPALLGGLCVSVMEEGRPVALNLDIPQSLRLVVCIPEYTLETEKARRVLPVKVTHQDAVFNLSRGALMVGALARGRLDLLGLASQDRLHQAYRKKLIPGFDDVVAAALGAGAIAGMLSGAGPTMLALSTDDSDGSKIGPAMVEAFAKSGIRAKYKTLSPELQGVHLITEGPRSVD